MKKILLLLFLVASQYLYAQTISSMPTHAGTLTDDYYIPSAYQLNGIWYNRKIPARNFGLLPLRDTAQTLRQLINSFVQNAAGNAGAIQFNRGNAFVASDSLRWTAAGLGITGGFSVIKSSGIGAETGPLIAYGVNPAYTAGWGYDVGEGVDDLSPVMYGYYGSRKRLMRVMATNGRMQLYGSVYVGTGNRMTYLDSAGRLIRSGIDPDNLVQHGDGVLAPTQVAAGTPAENQTIVYRNSEQQWSDGTGFKNIGTGANALVQVNDSTLGFKSDQFISSDESIEVTPDTSGTTRIYDVKIKNPVPQEIRNLDISTIVFKNVPGTVTEKWIRKRIITFSAIDTLQPDKALYDAYFITAQNQPIHFKNPAPGAMQPGDMITINVEDNGQARTMTWGTAFRAKVLPASTVPGEAYQIGLQYSPSGTGTVEVSGATTIPAQYVRTDQNNTWSTNSVNTFPASALYAGLVIGGTNSDPTNSVSGSIWRQTAIDRLSYKNQAGTVERITTDNSQSTFTNKRNVPVVTSSFTQPAANTITPDLAFSRQYWYLNLTANTAIAAPLNPQNGETLLFWFKDNGTAKSLTWATDVFAAPTDWPLPESTTPDRVMMVAFQWHSWAQRWVLVTYKDNYNLAVVN